MKNNYFTLSKEQQVRILEQAAAIHALPKQAIEKDLWISAILQVLFTLPCADSIVFKGGTSISKVWRMVNRFSEDIDLAINRAMFNLGGDLTKKQVKKLRKASSLFVKENLYQQLTDAIKETTLDGLCEIEAQPDGVGDSTYPEPRIIYVRYQTVFEDKLDYIAPVIKIEAGSRSLLEPTSASRISSMVESALPTISTTIAEVDVITAVAEKTFLEKSFLLHELFSVNNNVTAKRRSRHIYDLHMMMEKGVAEKAIKDDELWKTIHHHRSTLTSMNGVDYTPDIRDHIQLVPPKESVEIWRADYDKMLGAMIYGSPPTFDELLESMQKLESLFKSRNISKNRS
ncbi:MAG: nucleotidyl transferase AbiEii/AbiGii toxin family protein [Bacteroidaceae bacterium]|nr:nucleotidyl transferase AbiEii/AbiGii toxin family protein [Bacteroidaceae bacterium]